MPDMPQLPDLKSLLEQAQKMQENMQKAQNELTSLIVEGSAGGGLVKVSLNGRHQVKRVKIDHSLMEEDTDVLEDMLVAAFNDAANKVESASQKKIMDLASNLQLPPELQQATGGEGGNVGGQR